MKQTEIWFDDVDPELMDEEDRQGLLDDLNKVLHHGKGNPNLNKGSESAGLTKYVGLDCEMVGIGPNGKENMLARVSIVNQHGLCIYDKFVAPQEEVTNFRSEVTGITSKDLQNADNFSLVQEEVSSILKGRILVGHALHNDLKVLFLTHPKSMIRDTSTYKKFKEMSKGNKPKLKKLSEMVLKVRIQEGAHNSVQDAQAAMKLFMLHRINWEKELAKQGWRKLKIKTNQEAEVLISAPSGLPNKKYSRAKNTDEYLKRAEVMVGCCPVLRI
ncbi:RNA exonuclease 4 [Apostichopus japonicus]|uniref:RNA exonuclease 4 n=1 Tax=Stichopus japonicus TaxID=307972 RepID=A0A2G8LIM6_STIJA|nr:RNA exonuclease 4 [Apostichopus japonicus]